MSKKNLTRNESGTSLVSTRTGGTEATARTGTTRPEVPARAREVQETTLRPPKRDVAEQREEFKDFDLGTFFNYAEWYKDDPYMNMAVSLFEQANPGTSLRSSGMVSAMMRRFPDSGDADNTTKDRRDELVANSVRFSLPSLSDSGALTWDKITYSLPIERHNRQARDSRLALLAYLDSKNVGRMTIGDMTLGFARICKLPGMPNPEQLLEEVIRYAQRAVQDLMLDPSAEHNDDISTKEFRLFLMFLQGYLDLWEIFYEVDSSSDAVVMPDEFCKCTQKLKDWGLKDPNLIKQPLQVFNQIDIDGSGYVTFGEFADYCVRRGLFEEVAKGCTSI